MGRVFSFDTSVYEEVATSDASLQAILVAAVAPLLSGSFFTLALFLFVVPAAVIGVAVSALLVQVGARLFGGHSAPLGERYRALAFAQAPLVIGVVPFVGSFIAFVYLLIVGVAADTKVRTLGEAPRSMVHPVLVAGRADADSRGEDVDRPGADGTRAPDHRARGGSRPVGVRDEGDGTPTRANSAPAVARGVRPVRVRGAGAGGGRPRRRGQLRRLPARHERSASGWSSATTAPASSGCLPWAKLTVVGGALGLTMSSSRPARWGRLLFEVEVFHPLTFLGVPLVLDVPALVTD